MLFAYLLGFGVFGLVLDGISLYSLGWPQTLKRSICFCFQGAGIKGVGHHVWLCFFKFIFFMYVY